MVVHEVEGILAARETSVEAIGATGVVTAAETRGTGEDSGMIAHRVAEETRMPVDMIAATDSTGRSMIARRMILAVARETGEDTGAERISIGVGVRWEWVDAIRGLGKYGVGWGDIGVSLASMVGWLVV